MDICKLKRIRNNTSYNTRKTIAQGFLDVALLLSNISQINFVVESGTISGLKTKIVLGFICLSILLQVIVGVMLMVIAHREQVSAREIDMRNENPDKIKRLTQDGPFEPQPREDRFDKTTAIVNTTITCLMFVILVVNIIINGLDISNTSDLEKQQTQGNDPFVENGDLYEDTNP